MLVHLTNKQNINNLINFRIRKKQTHKRNINNLINFGIRKKATHQSNHLLNEINFKSSSRINFKFNLKPLSNANAVILRILYKQFLQHKPNITSYYIFGKKQKHTNQTYDDTFIFVANLYRAITDLSSGEVPH